MCSPQFPGFGFSRLKFADTNSVIRSIFLTPDKEHFLFQLVSESILEIVMIQFQIL